MGELLAELIDVDGLVIRVDIVVVKGVLRYEVHDVLVVVKAYHRAVHPCLVLGNEGKVRVGGVDNHGNHVVAEDEVALNEQRVVLLQLVLDNSQRVDVVGLVVDGILGKLNL